MEAIRQWALTICTVTVAVAVLEMLLPQKRGGRLLRMCASAVMVCAVLAPLKDVLKWRPEGLFSLHNTTVEYSTELEKTTLRQAEKLTERTLATALLTAVGELLPERSSIAVDAASDENGCIELVRVTVRVNGGSVDEAEVIEKMSRYVGIDREIITIEYE